MNSLDHLLALLPDAELVAVTFRTRRLPLCRACQSSPPTEPEPQASRAPPFSARTPRRQNHLGAGLGTRRQVLDDPSRCWSCGQDGASVTALRRETIVLALPTPPYWEVSWVHHGTV